MKNSYSCNRCPGQGLSEYTLIGFIIATVAIVGLAQLGINLNGHFGSMIDARQPVNVSSVGKTDISNGINVSQGLRFTTAKGLVIDLPGYPHSLSQTITTAGANGTTDLLANNLESLAEQLLKSGEISQTQYNSLITLANKGHELAVVEGKFEQIAAESASGYEMEKAIEQDSTLGYWHRGRFYYNLSYLEGDNDPTTLRDPLTEPAKSYIQEFLDVYRSTLKNGSLQDPSVEQVVSNLVANIAYLANVVGGTSGQVATGQFPPDQMASYMMHQDSTGICAAGNGTDSGFQCSG
jgi:hypothetical protein